MKNIMLKKLLVLLAAVPFAAQAYEGPTMGWSSWNSFSVWISENIIKGQADAMVETGLADAGYQYVNIDDGFQNGRTAAGKLKVNTSRFPRGLKVVADYIHSKGLKAGIYSDAGDLTCGSIGQGEQNCSNVGFYGHEQIDADFYFKECGFDFIKVDYCGGSHLALDEQEQYTRIYNALKATGCDFRYNLCRWAFPGTWAHDVSTSWRTTGDINASWGSVRSILAENLYLSPYCYGGCYNDMDMLEVGRGMTEEEDKTHFGMWCIMASPLLIGCDMSMIAPKTLELLKNPELIAINQDSLALQAYVVQHQGGTYVLTKDINQLYGCERAVALYNPTDNDVQMAVSLGELDLAGPASVRDVYEHKDMPVAEDGISVMVPAHGTRIYTVRASRRIERYLYEAETAYLSSYQEVRNNTIAGQESATYDGNGSCSGHMKVGWLGNRAENDLQWRNVYSLEGGEYQMTLCAAAKDARSIHVQVNGEDAGVVNVKTADWGTFASYKINVNLRKGENVIRLYNADSFMPDVDYMTLQPAGQSDATAKRMLADARQRLKTLSESSELTTALQKSIATLLASSGSETLSTTMRTSYLNRINTLLGTISDMMPALADYRWWMDVTERNMEVSVESAPLATLRGKVETAVKQLGNANTVATAEKAVSTLKSAIDVYLRAEGALPEPGKEFDMTFFLKDRDMSSASGWTGTAPTLRSGVGEHYQVTFDMYQLLTNMKPGVYTVRCNALYRTGDNDGGAAYRKGTEVIPAVLYANSESVPVKSLYSETWPEASGFNKVDALNGYPHSMYAAGIRFAEGCYENEVVLTLESKSSIKVGLKSDKQKGGSWCCFDNFRLTYHGLPSQEDGIGSVQADEVLQHGSSKAGSAIYDLSGRPVNNGQGKGVYIENGRKVMK